MIENQVTTWESMEYHELKIAVAHAIMGQGMGGSSQYLHFVSEYFEKIGNQKVKDDVLNIIYDLAAEFDMPISSRAVCVLAELPILNKKSFFLNIIQMLYPIIDELMGVESVPEPYMKYLDIICEINKTIPRLNIVEAIPFLEKQVKDVKWLMPSPLSNEYYLYHLSSVSALESLKAIDPGLAKKYM